MQCASWLSFEACRILLLIGRLGHAWRLHLHQHASDYTYCGNISDRELASSIIRAYETHHIDIW